MTKVVGKSKVGGRSGHLIQQGQHALALVDGKLEHERPRLGRLHLDARSTEVILPVDDVWTGVVVADEDDVDVLPCREEDLAELEAARCSCVRGCQYLRLVDRVNGDRLGRPARSPSWCGMVDLALSSGGFGSAETSGRFPVRGENSRF